MSSDARADHLPHRTGDPEPRPIRLALAASHRALRAALLQLIATDRRLDVVAVVDDHHGAARCLLQHHPDAMVVALSGVLRDGGARLCELRTLSPDTALVVVSTGTTALHRVVAADAGATAFVALDGPAGDADALVGVIHRAVAGAHS